jgi:hypothetical protein
MKPLRGLWFALAALALPLLGAALSAFPQPVVVVYPLTVTGPTAAEAGSNLAVLLSSKMIALGGVTVKPYPPGTDRPQFLDAALKVGADYYVTGYLTPVGDEVSLVVQVVSTHSGSIVFSNTAMVRTYTEAAGQADVLRDAIVRHAGRSFAAIDEPPPAPSDSPASTSKGVGVDLGKTLSRIGKHGSAAPPSAAASASPVAVSSTGSSASTAAAATPSPGPRGKRVAAALPVSESKALIFSATGSADAASRVYAAGALSTALARVGIAGGLLPVAADQALPHAGQLCAANAGYGKLYAPSLTLESGGTSPERVTFEVAAYDCAGTLLGRQSASETVGKRGGVNGAIDRAATQAAAGLAKAAVAPSQGSS